MGRNAALLTSATLSILILGSAVTTAPSALAADGIVWTPDTSITSFDAVAAAYGNGTYVVAGGSTTSVLVSTDGASFTTAATGVARTWNAITYAGGRFVAVGDTGGYMSSNDGVTWSGGANTSNTWSGVAYGNSTYTAVSSNPGGWSAMTSADGATWTSRSIGENDWTDVAFGNGTFVAVKNGKTATSADGTTWTVHAAAALNNPYGIAFGNGTFAAVSSLGSRVWVSTDGVTWTAAASIESESWKAVSFGDGTFLAVADGGATATSTDGSTWTSQGSPLGVAYLQAAAVGGGRFLIGAVSGSPRVAFGVIPSTQGPPPPSWLRAYARASEATACEEGWAPSWEAWPNGGTGGWTCTQSIAWINGGWATVAGYR